MGLQAVWKVLEELITTFRSRGVTVPARVMNKLRSAKALINILETNIDREDIGQKIEKQLLDLQLYLISEGEKHFGKEYVEDWFQRLNEARRKPHKRKEKKTKIMFGIPKDQKWIRVKISSELPAEKMKNLASNLNLSYDTQNNSYLLVYGEEGAIKDFLRMLTEDFRQKKD